MNKKNNSKPVQKKSNWKPGDLLIRKHDGKTVLLIEENDWKGSELWNWKCFRANNKSYGDIILQEKNLWCYLHRSEWIVVSTTRQIKSIKQTYLF